MDVVNTTPALGKPNLNQDPADFGKLLDATIEGSAAADLVKPAEVVQPPANKHPQDNGEQTKAPDEKKPEQKVASDIAKPSTTEDSNKVLPDPKAATISVDEQRHRDATKAIQEKSEERKRAVLALTQVVKADPNHLKTVATYDKKLADEVAKEVFGHASYQDYVDATHLNELRATDPDKAEIEERLIKLEREHDQNKADREVETERLREQGLTQFLTNKGLNQNQFDADYIAFNESLSLLDPNLVASNPLKAYETAFQLTGISPQAVDAKKVEMQQTLNRSNSESVTRNGMTSAPSAPSSYSEKQEDFAAKIGVTLT